MIRVLLSYAEAHPELIAAFASNARRSSPQEQISEHATPVCNVTEPLSVSAQRTSESQSDFFRTSTQAGGGQVLLLSGLSVVNNTTHVCSQVEAGVNSSLSEETNQFSSLLPPGESSEDSVSSQSVNEAGGECPVDQRAAHSGEQRDANHLGGLQSWKAFRGHQHHVARRRGGDPAAHATFLRVTKALGDDSTLGDDASVQHLRGERDVEVDSGADTERDDAILDDEQERIVDRGANVETEERILDSGAQQVTADDDHED
jgi:hypothetical protein